MLRLSNLAFRYPKAPQSALEDVSFDVPRGRLLGLLGPNGAGKTTLQRMLVRQLAPDSGMISLDGRPLSEHAPSAITLVPQALAFYCRFSVIDNLRFFASLSDNKKDIDTVIHICQLEQHLQKLAQHLSGGLQRRLNLAIGLLAKPDYLLLDEPTVGVDPHSRHFLLEAIAKLNATGTTIIYASHYMEEVEALCDEVVIIDHGKVKAKGTVADLCERLPNVLEISTTRPLTESEHQELMQLYDVAVSGLSVCLKPKNDVTALQAVAALQALTIPVASLNYRQQRLEALFMEETERALRD